MVKAKKQTGIKTLAWAVALATSSMFATNVYAAGLGRITVQSALGQPLRAQLEISASKDELASIVAQLASADAFRLAGVEYAPALTSLRFSRTIKENAGRKYIDVTTDRPLNEPFIDMLVELNWASGRLVREYTFLIDPPELPKEVMLTPPAVTAPAAVSAPDVTATVAGDGSDGVESKPVKLSGAPVADSSAGTASPQGKTSVAKGGKDAASTSPSQTSGSGREIRPGDTLGKIAREYKPDGVSLDQMLVALFRENSDAFDGNMNRMRAGKILRIPDAGAIAELDAQVARKEVLAQATDFSAYRSKLASRAASAPAKEAAAPQGTQGKVAPKVEETAPPAKSGADKLAVSKTETAGKDASKARVGALEEDLVARDRALKDANSRIADLEKNLTDLKKLAELKSQAAASAQKSAETSKSAPAAPPAASVASAPPVPVLPVTPPPAPVKPVVTPPVDSPKPAEVKPAEPAKPAESAVSASEAPAKPELAAPAAEAPKPPPPMPKKPVLPPPEPEPEPDFMEENGLLVMGGGGLVALLLGYFGFAAYRRKRAAAPATPADEAPPPTEPSAAASSVFSDTVTVSQVPTTVDNLARSSVLDAVDDGAGASIDPLEEADTFLAFGKDSQAEEILLDALKKTPSRWAIHLKLLEIYSARRSVVQFNTLAEDLRQQTNARGGEWERAAEMGRALDPNNSLYASASELVMPATTPTRTAPPAMDMAATMVFTAPPIPAQAPPEPEENAAVLDFDLGLDEESAPAPVAAATVKESSDVAALDFDLDLGNSAAPVNELAVAEVKSESKPAGLNIDFDLELPVAPTLAEEPAPMAVELSLPEVHEAPEPVALALTMAPVKEPDVASVLTLDVPSLEIPSLEIPAPAEPAPDFDFDLGDAPKTGAEAHAVTEVDLPLDPSENPEAATKLELALAYEEMGDRDGARELFQEVLTEGSSAQQAAARARLEQLG